MKLDHPELRPLSQRTQKRKRAKFFTKFYRSFIASRMNFFLRYFILKVFHFFFFLFVVGIPSLLLFTHFYGVGNSIKEKIESALSGEHYEIKIEKLFFSLTKGLEAKNLSFYEKDLSHRLLVQAADLSLLPNLSSLIHGKIEIESLLLSKTKLDIPLSKEKEPRLVLDQVEANISSNAGALKLNHASFLVNGILFKIHGSFLNPKTFTPQPMAAHGPGNIAQTIHLIEESISQFHWDHHSPVIKIEVHGDLTDPKTIEAPSILFEGESLSYHEAFFKKITAELSYEKLTLSLEKLILEEALGTSVLWGYANFQEKKGSLQFSGEANLLPLAATFRHLPILDEIKLKDPPYIEGSLLLDWNEPTLSYSGSSFLRLGAFSLRGLSFTEASLGTTFKENALLVRDFSLIGEPGSLKVDFMMTPQDYRLKGEASLYPQLLAPFFGGDTKKFFSSADFKDPLSLSFEAHSPLLEFNSWEGKGSLHAGISSVRKSWIESLSSSIELHSSIFSFKDILISANKREAQGEFSYDVKNQLLLFSQVHSFADPVTILLWIDPKIADIVKDYRFTIPPEVTLFGSIGLKDPQKNDLKIQIKAPQGLDYTLLKKNLSFSHVLGEVLIKVQHVLVDIKKSHLFGGDVDLHANVSIVPGEGTYGAKIHFSDVDFKSLTSLYLGYDNSEGKATGFYNFTARSFEETSMKGEGALSIKDGKIYAMPIFGPLSSLMNDIIPGLGYQSAREAKASFNVQEGKIMTQNLEIQSPEFTLLGSGSIFYLEDKMNMNVRLNVRGLPGILLFPVSKLFEYTSEGSAKHPLWKTRYIPSLPF